MVKRNLAKVETAGSSPVVRSRLRKAPTRELFLYIQTVLFSELSWLPRSPALWLPNSQIFGSGAVNVTFIMLDPTNSSSTACGVSHPLTATSDST